MRVRSAGVVPTFGPFEDRRGKFASGIPVLAAEEFALNRGAERFGERVIHAGGNAFHRSRQAGCLPPVTKLPGCVLPAPAHVKGGSLGGTVRTIGQCTPRLP